MLAELVGHVVGVDPDRDWITLAVVEAHTSGVVAEGRFPATGDGYDDAIEFVDRYSVETERAWVIEGTGSYGRGLVAALARRGEWVIEFDRSTRKTKDGAKSDALDAVRAAQETLGRARLSVPRAGDGMREAIRVHAVTRAAAVRARTGAINELKALIVTADETLRRELRGLSTSEQVAVCAQFRDQPTRAVARRCTRQAMRAVARRVQHLDAEVAELAGDPRVVVISGGEHESTDDDGHSGRGDDHPALRGARRTQPAWTIPSRCSTSRDTGTCWTRETPPRPSSTPKRRPPRPMLTPQAPTGGAR